MIEIRLSPLGRGIALIDDDDFPLVSQHTWWLKTSRRTAIVYAYTWIDGRNIPMHRLLMPQVERIDHRNGNGLDNCRQNLRPASRSENQWNARKRDTRAGTPTSSRFKGVWFDPSRGRWGAGIRHSGKTHHLGRFDREEDAAKAYDAAAREAFGEFARLNYP